MIKGKARTTAPAQTPKRRGRPPKAKVEKVAPNNKAEVPETLGDKAHKVGYMSDSAKLKHTLEMDKQEAIGCIQAMFGCEQYQDILVGLLQEGFASRLHRGNSNTDFLELSAAISKHFKTIEKVQSAKIQLKGIMEDLEVMSKGIKFTQEELGYDIKAALLEKLNQM